MKLAGELIGMFIRLYSGEQGGWSNDSKRVADLVIETLRNEDAHEELANGYRLLALVHQNGGRLEEAIEAIKLVTFHAREAGNQRPVARSGLGLTLSAVFGPTPVSEAIEQCELILAGELSDRQVASVIQCKVAQLRAMNGDIDGARTMYRQARELLRELGQAVHAAATGLDVVVVEALAGDLAAAEREVRADYAFLEARGETFFLSTMAAMLARVVRDQGRDDEALVLSKAAEKAAAADDLDAQVRWRAARAPILARAQQFESALLLVNEAVDLARTTGRPILLADALFDRATVQQLAGKVDEAKATVIEARAVYKSKGDEV